MIRPTITVSIVSHRHNELINRLLDDMEACCARTVNVIVTENTPDPEPLRTVGLTFPVERIINPNVKGFGANHNSAFQRCTTDYYCVCNPDIRLPRDPFPALVAALQDPRAAIAAPLVRGPGDRIEDSVRYFPTPWSLAKKALVDTRDPDYPPGGGRQEVDWCAGMFMLFRSDAYREMGGFDESYFLYYEDVDLCRRVHLRGDRVIFEPAAEVVHYARRASRKNPRLAWHHIRSMARYLLRVPRKTPKDESRVK